LNSLKLEDDEANGPVHGKSKIKKIGDFMKNIFSLKPKFSTKKYQDYERGHIEEVEFATTVWEMA